MVKPGFPNFYLTPSDVTESVSFRAQRSAVKTELKLYFLKGSIANCEIRTIS